MRKEPSKFNKESKIYIVAWLLDIENAVVKRKTERHFSTSCFMAIHHAVNSHAGQHCKPRWR